MKEEIFADRRIGLTLRALAKSAWPRPRRLFTRELRRGLKTPVVPGSSTIPRFGRGTPVRLTHGEIVTTPARAESLGLTFDAEQVRTLAANPCRVYWGTHGCDLERGHDGPHVCVCAVEDEGQFDPETREYYDDPGVYNVGAPPYYGPETTFYGEDATPQERGEA